MKITVYTKNNCPNCLTAKALLNAKGLKFEEHNAEDTNVRAMFRELYPEVRQMPQIFINDIRVGGLAGLQNALTQLGFV